jgi:Tol biopolymer transport system component
MKLKPKTIPFKSVAALSLLVAAFLLLNACTRAVRTGDIPGEAGDIISGHIAYTGLDGNMYILNPIQRKTTQITDDASSGKRGRTEYRYPSWSFDGKSLAFVRYSGDSTGNFESTLLISNIRGNEKKSLLTTEEIVPFYLYWSPDSSSISFLSSLSSAEGLLLQVLSADGGKPSYIDMGQPFYWSWSVDSSSILTHTDGSTVEKPDKAAIKLFDLTDNNYTSTTLNYFPAFFQAPRHSPDGNSLLIAAEMLQRHSTLVIARNNGEPQDLLVDWQGPITFDWSPDGTRIAYVTGRPSPIGGSIGPLNILNVEDGEEKSDYQVRSSNVIAFFWSPDSSKIALFEPQIVGNGESQETFVLAVSVLNVSDGSVKKLTKIRPTRPFIGQVIPYYDQFQRSHTIWSPDSRYIVLNGTTSDNLPGIFIVSAEGERDADFLAYGVYPFWSWQ